MITEKDLKEAIAECIGRKNPDANTCLKLASFYTIQDHLYPREERGEYSLSAPPTVVQHDSGTEFSELMNGRDISAVLDVIDEAMTAMKVLNPRFYESVVRKLKGT